MVHLPLWPLSTVLSSAVTQAYIYKSKDPELGYSNKGEQCMKHVMFFFLYLFELTWYHEF